MNSFAMIILALLQDLSPQEYDDEWKGWYFLPILAAALVIGYWVRKRRKK